MRIFTKMGTVLLLAIASLTACSGAPAASDPPKTMKPAHFTVVYDVSNSTPANNDPAVTKAVERHVIDQAKQMQLGDSMTLIESGARTADRMIAYPTIVPDYNLRMPAASAMLAKQMQEMAARYKSQGGDGATNLLLTLESTHPVCTDRSVVMLVTDGLEESAAYSTSSALNANEPVNLPPPAGKFLSGCRIVFLAFGMTSDPSTGSYQLLPSAQLAILRSGWEKYLGAAGVQPSDIEFVSVL